MKNDEQICRHCGKTHSTGSGGICMECYVRLPDNLWEIFRNDDEGELRVNIEEKMNTIFNGAQQEAIEKIQGSREARFGYQFGRMSRALALLTSQVKAEREEGKAMVRRWKHRNTF